MQKGFYEFEKRDKTIYDNIHEYCFCEKVNEELLRVFVKKKWNKNLVRRYGFLSTSLSFIRMILK